MGVLDVLDKPPPYGESLSNQLPRNDSVIYQPNDLSIITIQPTEQGSGGILRRASNCQADMIVKEGNRLIIDFEKVACCMGQKVGLHPQVKNRIPLEIECKGISRDTWFKWMSKLDEIQKKAPSICGCLIMFCFPGLFVQSTLCALLCPLSMDHMFSWLPCCYGDWYAALKNWMDDVNNVLNQVDMHAKLVTYKPFNYAPRSALFEDRTRGKDQNYEMSFLIIALTKEESIKLQIESWDHGINDKCTSGIGRCL